MRWGFKEFTKATGWRSVTRRAIFKASSKLPRTARMRAPWATAWASLPMAILPWGTST